MLQRKISSRMQAVAASTTVTATKQSGLDKKDKVETKGLLLARSNSTTTTTATGTTEKEKTRRSASGSPVKERTRTTRSSARAAAAAATAAAASSTAATTTNRNTTSRASSSDKENDDGGENVATAREQQDGKATPAAVAAAQGAKSAVQGREVYEICWKRLQAALTATDEADLVKLNGALWSRFFFSLPPPPFCLSFDFGGARVDDAAGPVTPPKVFIKSWIDYTHKYGTAYQLTDGSAGVYFNDSTTMIYSPNRKCVSLLLFFSFLLPSL
jgi:hypothetical protein